MIYVSLNLHPTAVEYTEQRQAVGGGRGLNSFSRRSIIPASFVITLDIVAFSAVFRVRRFLSVASCRPWFCFGVTWFYAVILCVLLRIHLVFCLYSTVALFIWFKVSYDQKKCTPPRKNITDYVYSVRPPNRAPVFRIQSLGRYTVSGSRY